MRRWPLLAGLMIVMTLLTGCGSRLRRLDMFVQEKTRRVTPVAEVQTDLGLLKLYRVTTWGQCGEGYELAGRQGWGTGQCGRAEALTMQGEGGGGYVLLMGSVNDPKIAQVKLALADGRQLEGHVVDTVWYLLLPGENQIPDARPIGLDASGNQLYPKLK